MDPVTLAFVAVSTVATFAIAAIAVGREARRLDAVAPRAVYDPDEAASFVADRLPPSTQARLTPAELDSLLRLHLRWMHDHGLQPRDVIDRRQDIVDRVVAAEEVLVAHLLGGATAAGVAAGRAGLSGEFARSDTPTIVVMMPIAAAVTKKAPT
jgi:hypothetical protein